MPTTRARTLNPNVSVETKRKLLQSQSTHEITGSVSNMHYPCTPGPAARAAVTVIWRTRMVTRSPGRGPGQQRPEPQTRTRSQARVNFKLHAHYMFCTRVLHDYMALWQGRVTRVLPLFPGMFRLNLQCQQQSTTIRCTEFR
jgi:hypothetical protein